MAFEFLNKKETSLKTASLINAVSKYSVVIMNLFFTAILARLLSPSDYGVVAILTVFTNFFILFSDMGMGTAVIQNKKLTYDDHNNIYSFSLILGVVLAILFSLFSTVIVQIYDNKIYYTLGPVLGLSLMFNTFNMVPNALLMKEKRFMLAGVRKVVANVVSYIAAIIMAYLGLLYYAIAFQSVFSALVIYLWNLVSVDLKIGRSKIFASVKKVLSFSIYQFLFSVVNYFTRNLDNLLSGYFFGQATLGYYDKAYRLMRYPVENLTSVIAPSIQPILSDYQDDKEYIYKKYNQILKLLSLASIFVSIFCFFASTEVVILLFGDQWYKSVESFHILSLSLIFQIVNGFSGTIYQSLNKTKQMLFAGIINSIILIASIIIGIALGSIETLALSYVIGFIIMFFLNQFMLSKLCFNKSFLLLMREIWKEGIIFGVMFIGMYFVPTLDNLLLSAVLKFGICMVLYLIMIFVTKEYKILASLLPKKLINKFKKKNA